MIRLAIVWIFTICYTFAMSYENVRNFEINITLESSGEFKITENILYDFGNNHTKHGIYRDIPINERVMGVEINTALKDFSVLMDRKKVAWEQSLYNNMIHLKIGEKNHIVEGQHLYTIEYRCTNGILPSSQDKDMIHWNATGSKWDIPILYAQVNLFLPPQLNSDNVKLLNHKLRYGNKWVNRHHLVVESDRALSIIVQFPKGLLTKSSSTILKQINSQKAKKEVEYLAYQKKLNQDKKEAKEKRILNSLYYWIPIIFILIFLWRKGFLGHKKLNKNFVKQYYPPPNLSVLQSGILLDKFSDIADYSAAVLELAHLGHIVIEESEDKTVLRKIHRKAELTEDQKDFLDALFYDNETFVLKSKENSNQQILVDKMFEINESLYAWAKNKGYAVDNFAKLRKIAERVIFTIVIVSFLYATYNEVLLFPTESNFILAFTTLFFLPGVITSFFRINILTKLIILIVGFGIGVMVIKLPFWVKNDITPIDVLTSYSALTYVLLMISMQVYQNLGHLTTKGKDIQLHLKGLEHYITNIKEDEIQRRLKNDPDYLEKLLPYAMLFGQIKHWLKIYDITKSPKPKWNKTSMNAITSIYISSIISRSHLSHSHHHYIGNYAGNLSSSSSSGNFSSGGGGSW